MLGEPRLPRGHKGYRAGDEGETIVEGSNVTVCVKTDVFAKIDVPQWLSQGLKRYIQA